MDPVELERYTEPLRQKFEAASDIKNAEGAKAYLRNMFDFYGIPSPRRMEILATLKKETGYPAPGETDDFVKYAWQQPQREWQYAAMEILAAVSRKGDFRFMETAVFMITSKSWWDTVDYIASNIAGNLFRKNPGRIIPTVDEWLKTDNLWLWRTAVLFQLKYGENTDKELLFGLCERLSREQDFFIRKAVGWALRQYSKTDAEAVAGFVRSHTLSALSRKEALKIINKGNS